MLPPALPLPPYLYSRSYPHFNPQEMLEVAALEAHLTAQGKRCPIVTFNAELDRIRRAVCFRRQGGRLLRMPGRGGGAATREPEPEPGAGWRLFRIASLQLHPCILPSCRPHHRTGYYPKLFYPAIGRIADSLLPRFTTAYYVKVPGAVCVRERGSGEPAGCALCGCGSVQVCVGLFAGCVTSWLPLLSPRTSPHLTRTSRAPPEGPSSGRTPARFRSSRELAAQGMGGCPGCDGMPAQAPCRLCAAACYATQLPRPPRPRHLQPHPCRLLPGGGAGGDAQPAGGVSGGAAARRVRRRQAVGSGALGASASARPQRAQRRSTLAVLYNMHLYCFAHEPSSALCPSEPNRPRPHCPSPSPIATAVRIPCKHCRKRGARLHACRPGRDCMHACMHAGVPTSPLFPGWRRCAGWQ